MGERGLNNFSFTFGRAICQEYKREKENDGFKTLNKDLLYKSATPMKLNRISTAGLKKKKT
jgi:hypothetical protein